MTNLGIVNKIKKQKGNLKYEYFIPVETSNKLLLIDQWISQEDLDRHHSSSMMNDIIKLRDKYSLKMKVERFISDNKSITENDKKYIKDSHQLNNTFEIKQKLIKNNSKISTTKLGEQRIRQNLKLDNQTDVVNIVLI
ncbi:MAG: antibiotic biosynthesis monooxygenase [Mycoplasmatales bacterium]